MVDFRYQLKKLTKPIIVGIAGDSGSGKTTYSNGIRRLLGTDLVSTITLDGYHKKNRLERKKSGKLPLDPEENKLDLFKKNLMEIKEGITADIPIYNHQSGDFEKPYKFLPTPVVIIEGLHALYPEFLQLYDFSIYADPSREVKWKWKRKRDTEIRGHEKKALENEMLERESAYKKWIDFQKTNADVVIKIHESRMHELAMYELVKDTPVGCYKVELIIKPDEIKLPTIPLPFNLSSILGCDEPAFLLATVPSLYWGKKVIVVHLDGVLSGDTIYALEKHIVSLTGIGVDKMLETSYITEIDKNEEITAVQFAQLLIAWRFLELINTKLNANQR